MYSFYKRLRDEQPPPQQLAQSGHPTDLNKKLLNGAIITTLMAISQECCSAKPFGARTCDFEA